MNVCTLVSLMCVNVKNWIINKGNMCSESAKWRMEVKINEQAHFDTSDLRKGRAACEWRHMTLLVRSAANDKWRTTFLAWLSFLAACMKCQTACGIWNSCVTLHTAGNEFISIEWRMAYGKRRMTFSVWHRPDFLCVPPALELLLWAFLKLFSINVVV